MKSIYEFKKGDIITRVAPSSTGDRSYLGRPVKFIGLANARIYFKHIGDTDICLFGKDPNDLAIDRWESGWDLYVDPKTLEEGQEFMTLNEKAVKEAIDRAIASEDYETAEKLQKLLSKEDDKH